MNYKITYSVAAASKLPINALDNELAYLMDTRKVLKYSTAAKSWSLVPFLVAKCSEEVVDATQLGPVKIYDLERAAQNFYSVSVMPRIVKRSGVLESPSITVGTNFPDYTDIMSPKTFDKPGIAVALPGGSEIFANITREASVEDDGAYQLQFDIIGYYR